MKNLKKYLTFSIVIIAILILTTSSYAFSVSQYSLNTTNLRASNILGICKIYKDGDVFYYKKNSSGSYSDNVTEAEMNTIRNSIKQKINSLQNGQYLMSKILKGDLYYDSLNKEFCFKRNAASSNTDTLTKVILVGYDDNYQFKSNLATKKGAYIAKKVGETEQFYVSYEDTWVESELTEMCDANSIVLSKSSIEIKVGEDTEIGYTVLPDNAVSKSVKVEYSGNIVIDTTTSGVVKINALKQGDAYIIVKLKSNDTIKARCDIKVVSNSSKPQDKNEDIASNIYSVDRINNYISKISPKIKVSKFKTEISSNTAYEIYDKNNNLVTDENVFVTTGMKLKTDNKTYTLIVKGDINGDGKISISDVVKVNLFSVNLIRYNEIEKKAADVNGDGRLSISDVVIMNLVSVGLRTV